MGKLLRVLIVDDSAATRELLAAAITSILGQADHEVETIDAESGLEALRFLPANELDLIVTDINMPDVNGLELISFARQHPLHKQTPVLVVSTLSASSDRDRALRLGANAYCEKPIDLRRLEQAVRPLLGDDAEALA